MSAPSWIYCICIRGLENDDGHNIEDILPNLDSANL